MNTKNLKPFDLPDALNGNAVMLRNGTKAYVRHHETELDASRSYELLGYLADGEHWSWGEDGKSLPSGDTSGSDIIGMYPKTRVINGFEVPAHETVEPPLESIYYLADTSRGDFHIKLLWENDDLEKEWLKRGLVFLNKEDAIANAKAMLGIAPHVETEE